MERLITVATTRSHSGNVQRTSS